MTSNPGGLTRRYLIRTGAVAAAAIAAPATQFGGG
jgi:hypothetical protein